MELAKNDDTLTMLKWLFTQVESEAVRLKALLVDAKDEANKMKEDAAGL